MSVSNILVATDNSTRSELAILRAAMIREQYAAKLTLLHVVDDDQPPELVSDASLGAERLLREAAARIDLSGVCEVATLVRGGDPFEVIVTVSQELAADLVVMGAHRRRILKDVFVGTSIERVMRTGSKPVLMVNQPPRWPYKKVAVALDLSEASANALKTAHALGFLGSAAVTHLHAFQPLGKGMMIYADLGKDVIDAYVARETVDAHRTVDALIAAVDGGSAGYDVRLGEGAPAAFIKRAVEKIAPDLLVIGTRGLRGFHHFLLGSVADEVLRTVECDVLVVPPVSYG